MFEKIETKKGESKVPMRLTRKEMKDVVEDVNDERLHTDEDGEHFTIHLGERVVNIPKRDVINISDGSGGFTPVDTGKYISDIIEKYDADSEKDAIKAA